jgi:hypothetical protein
MRVLVTGGTGLVGRTLRRALEGAGHGVVVVSRGATRARGAAVPWDAVGPALGESDAVVNLAGEPIAARRWTAAQKRRILESRVAATSTLVEAAAAAARRPAVLINASAVGYYGDRGDEVIDEGAAPGRGFLAEVCQAWEREAERAEALGLRVVRLRLGIVLAPDGGALARMVLPVRCFLGGRLGDGRQWMSWIHVADVAGLVCAILADQAYSGAINATAPGPVTNRDFMRALGRALSRPAWLPAPASALRLALGEMADMLLTGQRVIPRAAERLGYRWRFPALEAALEDCL